MTAGTGSPGAYRATRAALRRMGDTVPGTFEITPYGIVHDMRAPNGPTN